MSTTLVYRSASNNAFRRAYNKCNENSWENKHIVTAERLVNAIFSKKKERVRISVESRKTVFVSSNSVKILKLRHN